MIMFKSLTKTVTGRRRQFKGKPNEDHVQFFENDKMLVVSVSDGCSGADYPLIAAKINAEVAEIIASNRMFWTLDEKGFKKATARIYSTQLAESGYPIEELSATTALLIINKETNDFLAFSVGDSAILALDEELNARPLLEPVNGSKKTQTVFTNDPSSIIRFAQYRRGRISAGAAAFIIYSDGAESLAVQPCFEATQLAAAVLLSNRTGEKYADHLLKQLAEINSDDITFAVVAAANEKTIASAQANYSGQKLGDELTTFEEIADCNDVPGKTKKAVFPLRGKYAQGKSSPDQMYLAATPEIPPLLAFLEQPRTASELIGSDYGLNERNFMDSILVLLRLRMIRADSKADGSVVFTACHSA